MKKKKYIKSLKIYAYIKNIKHFAHPLKILYSVDPEIRSANNKKLHSTIISVYSNNNNHNKRTFFLFNHYRTRQHINRELIIQSVSCA